VLGQPAGLKGNKLRVKTLFITYLEHHLNDMLQAVEDAGVSVVDVMASPLATSLGILNKSQKIAGCILANIGSETLSLAVFENGTPISIEVFPIGSNDITNDIALGLQLSLEDAEYLKKGDVDKTEVQFSKKKLEEIVDARLSDIFEIIEAHLKKIKKNGLLPAGILITGGGSGISDIADIAKSYLKLPTKVSALICDEEKAKCLPKKFNLQDSTWAVAYGLGIFGIHADQDGSVQSGSFGKVIRQTITKFTKWLGQFLP
jgi:cell division protein FtsA